MSDPLALLPLAIAAGGGRLGPFAISQLVAAGLTLLQRSAPLVRALAGKRSAILMPDVPAFFVALAASDGRGAVLLDRHASPQALARQLADADVGAVFTLASLVPLLPDAVPVALLDDAPRTAHVRVSGRDMVVDLGSHHGLSLEGEMATEGRDEECVLVYRSSGVRHVHTHRALIAASRAAVGALRLTPVDHVLSLLSCRDPEALAACIAAPLMAGGRLSFAPEIGAGDAMANVLAAVDGNDVSMIAGRWRTASGIQVTAYHTAKGLQELRDGTLVTDAR